MNDESRKTKKKTRCYIICAVILIIVSIAAIEVVYQVHFKYEDDSNLPFPTPEPFTGSWSRQFIVLFMKKALNTTETLYVTSVHGVKMNVITSERLNNSLKALVDRSVPTYSAEKFSISSSMELESFKKETKCVLIETSDDAMIFSQTHGSSSVGITTLIPVHKLSIEYIIISSNPVKCFSQFAIASLHENTKIWITFKMKEGLQIDGEAYQNGDVLILNLNHFETYQIEHTVDMTGTVVVSSSPIAVFSGNKCNPVTGQSVCDHMFEQLPPTSSIDTAYVVTPHMHSNTKIRIIATEFSIIFCNCTYKSMSKLYNRLEYVDIVISRNESCYIESGKPIMVASFGLSSSLEYVGELSMSIVPGINYYRNYYKIIVPFTYEYNYLSIVMKGNTINSLRINGETVNAYTIVYEKIVSNLYSMYDFHIRIIRVYGGEMMVRTMGGEMFGLTCAGTNLFQAYAFSGNSV